MKEFNPNDAIDYIFKNAPMYAQAKGELAELEAYKSSLKAIKMAQSGENTIAGKEMEAYRSPEYQDLCKGIGAATEKVELLKWRLEAARMKFQAWQTQSANDRQLDRMIK